MCVRVCKPVGLHRSWRVLCLRVVRVLCFFPNDAISVSFRFCFSISFIIFCMLFVVSLFLSYPVLISMHSFRFFSFRPFLFRSPGGQGPGAGVPRPSPGRLRRGAASSQKGSRIKRISKTFQKGGPHRKSIVKTDTAYGDHPNLLSKNGVVPTTCP